MPDATHLDVIKALGGKARIATLLGLSQDVLKKWHTRGVPYKYWLQIIEIGASLDPPIVITQFDLARNKPGHRSRPVRELEIA